MHVSATVGKKENAESCCTSILHNAAVFFRKNVDVIIVIQRINLRRILPVLKCYEIIAIFKALSYINETPATPLYKTHC